MSNAILSQGTILARGATPIAEVTSLQITGNDRQDIDVTHFGSGIGRDYIAGLLTGATIQANVNFLPQDASQRNEMNNLTQVDPSPIFNMYSITWPTGTQWSFRANVTSFGAVAR